MDTEDITQKIESVVEAIKKPGLLARVLSAVAYLGILSLVPIMLRSNDDFVRFNARQGLLLFISEIVFTLIWIIPFIGWVIGFIGWILCFIFSIGGFFGSLAGKRYKVPVLNKFVGKVKI